MFKRDNGLLSWANSHNSVWEMSKSHCLRFTRRRNVAREDFTIDGFTIPCRKSAKLLGVIIDQELRWKEHAEFAASKGTKLVLAISRLTHPTFGMPHKHMRRLYISIALPKMEYAAEVWFEPIRRVPGRKPLKGSVGHANKISKVQNLAARMITGTQRSTPIELLLLHANLLPTRLRMEEQVYKATLRLCTLPASHPLSPLVRRCANRYVQSHRSPLHELFHAFDLHPDYVETRSPFRMFPPDWSPPFTLHIDSNKDNTAEYCRNRSDDVRIFTDGSGYEDGIGAASTLYYKSQLHTAHYHLGDASEHTVFESEICAVILATHQMLSLKPRNPRSLLIALDNQAVIRALPANRRQPSQYLLDEALRGLSAIRKRWPRIRITIAWTPGHHDLDENEAVDGEAKRAAQGMSSSVLPKLLRKPLPESSAALKATKHQSIREASLHEWISSPRYQKFQNVDPWTTAPALNRLLSNLPRNESSLLVQLRTGHGPLNAHLARIKSTDSPLCPRCHKERETAKHVLLHCPHYSEARHILRTKAKYSALFMRRLLSEPKTISHTMKFLKSTHRFHPFL
jgi:ribonuclease HI